MSSESPKAFKYSTRTRIMPTDPAGLKKYWSDMSKKVNKVKYAKVKINRNKALRDRLIQKLQLLTDDDFAALSRTMLFRMKGLNDAFNEDYAFDQADEPDSPELCDTDSQEGDIETDTNVASGENLPKIKLALKKSS
jgi:hypothetical protein